MRIVPHVREAIAVRPEATPWSARQMTRCAGAAEVQPPGRQARSRTSTAPHHELSGLARGQARRRLTKMGVHFRYAEIRKAAPIPLRPYRSGVIARPLTMLKWQVVPFDRSLMGTLRESMPRHHTRGASCAVTATANTRTDYVCVRRSSNGLSADHRPPAVTGEVGENKFLSRAAASGLMTLGQPRLQSGRVKSQGRADHCRQQPRGLCASTRSGHQLQRPAAIWASVRDTVAARRPEMAYKYRQIHPA